MTLADEPAGGETVSFEPTADSERALAALLGEEGPGGSTRPFRHKTGDSLEEATRAMASSADSRQVLETERWPAAEFKVGGLWREAAMGRIAATISPERPTHRGCGGRVRPAATLPDGSWVPATCDADGSDVDEADIIPPVASEGSAWGPGTVGVVWSADENGQRYPVELTAGGYLVADPCCRGGHNPQYEIDLDAEEVVVGPPETEKWEVAQVPFGPGTWACADCAEPAEPTVWYRERLPANPAGQTPGARLTVWAPDPRDFAARAAAAFEDVSAAARRAAEEELTSFAHKVRAGLAAGEPVQVGLPVAMYHRESGRPDEVSDGGMFVELDAGGAPAAVQGTLRLRQVTTTAAGLRIDVCALEERVTAGQAAEMLLPWDQLSAAVGEDGDAVSKWRERLSKMWEDRAGYSEWEDAGLCHRWLAGDETAWSVWSHVRERALHEQHKAPAFTADGPGLEYEAEGGLEL